MKIQSGALIFRGGADKKHLKISGREKTYFAPKSDGMLNIHFWEHFKNNAKTSKSSRNGRFLDATGWESIPRGQKMMADSIFDVPEA